MVNVETQGNAYNTIHNSKVYRPIPFLDISPEPLSSDTVLTPL